MKFLQILLTGSCIVLIGLCCSYFYSKSLPITQANWSHGSFKCNIFGEVQIVVKAKRMDDKEFQELLNMARNRCK